MSYKSLKEAVGSIAQSSHIVNGKTYDQWSVYLGRNAVDGKPKRLFASSREKLESDIRDFYKTIRKGGEMVACLTPCQVNDARMALDLIAQAGARLSLTDCARSALAGLAAATVTRTVKDCYEEYLAGKDTSELDRKCTVSRVGKWIATLCDTSIGSVTAKTVTDYLNAAYGNGSKTTWNGHFKYIDTFLRWCAKKPRCYIAESPLVGVSAKHEEWHEPDCISVDAMRTLMRCVYNARDAHPEYTAYVALSFFCGIRREEILRIGGKRGAGETGDAARINLDTRTIAILKPKGYLKGIKPRAFEIPETALAWMKTIDFADAVRRVNEHTVDHIYKAARGAGAEVPKNCGRHSFITYHVCAYENLAKTLMVAGTSEGMSESHYRSLKSHDEGVAYFAITPAAFATSSAT